MVKNFVKKGLVIGVLLLFIGASFVSNASSEKIKLNYYKSDFIQYKNLENELDSCYENEINIHSTEELGVINFHPPYDWGYEDGEVKGLGATYHVDVDKSEGRIQARTQATGAGMYLSGSATAVGALGIRFEPPEGNLILRDIYFNGYWAFLYWCNDDGFYQSVMIWYQVEEGDNVLHAGKFFDFERDDGGNEVYEKDFNYHGTPDVALQKGHEYEIWFAIGLYSASEGKSKDGSATLHLADYPDVYLDLDRIRIVNQPPNTPQKPSGPLSGQTYTLYLYKTKATDPNNEPLYYKWDWGDEYSNWLGPYPSGQQVSTKHSWEEEGTYNIRVKAKDGYGEESPWSPTLTVTMPRNRMVNNILLINLLKQFSTRFLILNNLLLSYIKQP